MELHEVTQDLFGPLANLAGNWEGSDGLDFSFHHEEGATGNTPYYETFQFKTFGPDDNGSQSLYGLDYRMAAWRMTELDDDPFHTEIGYWLYDPVAHILSRCFMVPRGSVIIASGQVPPTATEFLLTAERGSTTNGILSNSYLDQQARSESYEVKLSVTADSWSYESNTVLDMANLGKKLNHTDRNSLIRVKG